MKKWIMAACLLSVSSIAVAQSAPKGNEKTTEQKGSKGKEAVITAKDTAKPAPIKIEAIRFEADTANHPKVRDKKD